jgi:hypothetical protein
MPQKTTHGKAGSLRLKPSDMVTIDEFKPWWIRCSKCSQLAYMMPMWREMKGECKCPSCGGVYKLSFDREYDRRFPSLPLWLKADFRGNVFWALNAEHLQLLERVIPLPIARKADLQRKALVFDNSNAVQSAIVDFISQEPARFAQTNCAPPKHNPSGTSGPP